MPKLVVVCEFCGEKSVTDAVYARCMKCGSSDVAAQDDDTEDCG